MTTVAPLILITPDVSASADTPSETTYTMRANYAAAVAAAGGLPLILPFEAQTMAAALALADGVLITGTAPGVEADPRRRAFETVLIEHAIRAQLPLLGICYGMQLIGEYLGANCVKSLPSHTAAKVEHLPKPVPDVFAHALQIETDSLLSAIAKEATGDTDIKVNSLHRHALTENGRLRITARAPDGVVEAIEGDTPGFCLGLQWHPEYELSEFDRAIFRRFVCASKNYSKRKTCHA